MLSTKSNDARILDGMKQVIRIFQDDRFMNRMANVYHFDMCDMSPSALIAYLQRHLENNTVEVATFTPFNPWSRAYAMFTPKHPDRVSLSSRKLTRYSDEFDNSASIAGSIIHEIIHLLNNKLGMFLIWHGDNSPVGKEMTAPYRIGREAKEFILENYLSK